ncbi:hypothetical protein Tco_0341772, partial [Tanacetum coccineum]
GSGDDSRVSRDGGGDGGVGDGGMGADSSVSNASVSSTEGTGSTVGTTEESAELDAPPPHHHHPYPYHRH